MLGFQSGMLAFLADTELVRLTPVRSRCLVSCFTEHVRRVLIPVVPVPALPLFLYRKLLGLYLFGSTFNISPNPK